MHCRGPRAESGAARRGEATLIRSAELPLFISTWLPAAVKDEPRARARAEHSCTVLRRSINNTQACVTCWQRQRQWRSSSELVCTAQLELVRRRRGTRSSHTLDSHLRIGVRQEARAKAAGRHRTTRTHSRESCNQHARRAQSTELRAASIDSVCVFERVSESSASHRAHASEAVAAAAEESASAGCESSHEDTCVREAAIGAHMAHEGAPDARLTTATPLAHRHCSNAPLELYCAETRVCDEITASRSSCAA